MRIVRKCLRAFFHARVHTIAFFVINRASTIISLNGHDGSEDDTCRDESAVYDSAMTSQNRVPLALLIGRVPIGLYFLIAGYNKIAGAGVKNFVDGAATNIPSYARSFGEVYLYALPFAEVVVGLLVVLGLLTRTSALLMSLMLISFLMAMAAPVYIHNLTSTTSGIPFDRNWLLLSGTLALTLLGPGLVSIDHLIHSRRKRAVLKAQT